MPRVKRATAKKFRHRPLSLEKLLPPITTTTTTTTTTAAGIVDSTGQTPAKPLRKNDAKGGWVIQKFGGTSIGKFAVGIADGVVRSYVGENKVAIVCSARSTETKEGGTTNRLLRAAEEALKPGSLAYLDITNSIQECHLNAATELLQSQDILESLRKDIRVECETLASFLGAVKIIGEISPKTKDIIVAVGEKLSCLFMTALLRDKGIDAEYVNLENIVPKSYPTAKGGLTQGFYDLLAERMARRIEECGDRVPVVTGYFGNVPGSLLTSVGRGYTDLCAALLAVGLNAEELQVWKEVDGIFTADPRKVPTARLIPTITPEEAAELTYYGSEVIHPFTMDQVIRARIPIRIKNVMNPSGPGTVIFPDSVPHKGGCETSRRGRQFSFDDHLRTAPEDPSSLRECEKRPTAVTTKNNIVVLNVHSNRKSLSHGFLKNIFSTLDKWQLAVDLISTSEVHVSMALLLADGGGAQQRMEEAIKELGKCGSVEEIPNLTILSLVGKHMKQMIGIAGRMFTTLAEAGVNIEMISQGASEINISCVIKQEDALRAMNILHTKLFTYRDVD